MHNLHSASTSIRKRSLHVAPMQTGYHVVGAQCSGQGKIMSKVTPRNDPITVEGGN